MTYKNSRGGKTQHSQGNLLSCMACMHRQRSGAPTPASAPLGSDSRLIPPLPMPLNPHSTWEHCKRPLWLQEHLLDMGGIPFKSFIALLCVAVMKARSSLISRTSSGVDVQGLSLSCGYTSVIWFLGYMSVQFIFDCDGFRTPLLPQPLRAGSSTQRAEGVRTFICL